MKDIVESEKNKLDTTIILGLDKDPFVIHSLKDCGGSGRSIFLHYAIQIMEESEKILEEVESLGKSV